MSRQKVTIYTAIVIAIFLLMIGKSIGQPEGWLIDDKGRPGVSDYIAMHAAGRLALEGRAAAAYDREQHRAAQDATVGRDSNANFPWAYPPTYFPIAAAVASLPYIVAVVLFPLLTLIAFSFVTAGIIGRWDGAIWMMATPAVLWNFCAGQNGFLNGAVLGAGLLLLPTRPLLAGVMFGALSYKPHLGLLLPLALAAAGYWRSFASAAVTAVATVLVSLAMFGTSPWFAFAESLGQFGSFVLSDSYGGAWRLQSMFGALRALGLPTSFALSAQYGWGIALAAGVVVLWRSDVAHELKAAGLAVAAVMISPYLFIYDMTVLTIAQAFVVRHMIRHGFVPAEVVTLIAANMAIYPYFYIHFPVGFLASVMIGTIIVARSAAYGSHHRVAHTGHAATA